MNHNYKIPNTFLFFIKLYKFITKKQKISLALIFSLILFTSTIELIGIGVVLPLTKQIINGINKDYFLFYIFIIFLILSNILSIFLYSLTSEFAWSIWVDFSSRLLNFYIIQNKEYHNKHNTDHLIKFINQDTQSLGQLIILPFLWLIAKLTIIFFVLLYLVYVNLIATLTLTFLFTSIYLIFHKSFGGKTKKYGEESKELFNLGTKLSNQALKSNIEISIYKKEDFFTRNYYKSIKNIIKIERNLNVIGNSPRYIFEIIVLLCLLFFILFSEELNLDFKTTLPILTLFGVAGYRCLPLLSHIYWATTSIKSRITNVIPLIEVFNKVDTNIIAFHNNSTLIEIKNLSYSINNKSILKNINCAINEGDKILLSGENGSGKSTLINLIISQLTPISGSITYNKKIVYNKSLSRISYIPQHPYLFDDTILNNITFGELNINQNQLDYAIQFSGLDYIIKKYNLTLEYSVGYNGSKLSGGQRQILAIARALYHNPKLLIIDEGTNAIDSITEKIVIDKLRKLDEVTFIVISHKDSIKDICNRNLNLADANLIET